MQILQCRFCSIVDGCSCLLLFILRDIFSLHSINVHSDCMTYSDSGVSSSAEGRQREARLSPPPQVPRFFNTSKVNRPTSLHPRGTPAR